MIAWTFDASRASQSLSRVIVSTNDPAVADAARTAGIDVPFDRPAALAADDTPMLDVLIHAVETLEAAGDRPDVLVLLQPTSPLRTAGHVDAAVRMLQRSDADAVVTVVPVPHRFNPASVMRLENEKLIPYMGDVSVTRRQDKPRVYARNGPAVLVVRRDVICLQRTLYGRNTHALVMAEHESIDIDTALDFELAALLLARRQAPS